MNYFAKRFLFIAGRNLAFNFFPFMFRERKQLQQSLETEVRVVYQYARVIDVCDGDNNCQHIPIDDIFYCKKNGNETDIYTVGGVKYTRYCSIKYLVQLFGNEDFIRISSSYLVPFQHIASCDGKTVVMNNMPWTETSLAFDLDTQRYPHAPAAIEEYLRACQRSVEVVQPDSKNEKNKKTSSIPPKEKLDAVLGYIQEHPGCRSTEIMSYTSYSQTTMDRCLFELKKQGLIKYSGSKKKGGYYLIVPPQEGVGVESESLQMQTNLEKPESDAHE